MIKIVFINPSVEKYSRIKIWSMDLMNTLFKKPMGTLPKMAPMILAKLTPPGHSFTYIDEEIEDVAYDEIDADLVALTAMTVQADRAYEIADEFRKRGVAVIMGGIHATVLPDEALLHCDAVAIGEGENTWPEILCDFEAGALKKRYDAKDYPPVTEMASPDISIIKHGNYIMFPLQATKGCPYDCDFCSVSFINGRRVRFKPVGQVLEEIAAYEQYNKGPIKKRYQFVDDNLYVNKAYARELFTALRKAKISWHGQSTLNTLDDDELLDLMAKSGCKIFSIGFESISEGSLKEANKAHVNQVDAYEKAINKLIQLGIIPGGFFIFGFDHDNKSIFKDTVRFVLEKHIINPSFCLLTPFPGTRLEDRLKDRIFDRQWRNYGVNECVFTPNNMTPGDLIEGAKWVSEELTTTNAIKRQLEYFWSKGPWKHNAPISINERLLLLYIGLQMRKSNAELSKLAYWSATRKNAVDFNIIMTALFSKDMVVRNSAELSAN